MGKPDCKYFELKPPSLDFSKIRPCRFFIPTSTFFFKFYDEQNCQAMEKAEKHGMKIVLHDPSETMISCGNFGENCTEQGNSSFKEESKQMPRMEEG